MEHSGETIPLRALAMLFEWISYNVISFACNITLCKNQMKSRKGLKHVIKIIFNQFPDCHHYCQKIYLVYLNECVGFFLYNQYLQVGQEFKLIQFSNFIKLPEMAK